MKTIKLFLLIALFIPFVSMAQTSKSATKTESSDKIEAYYFHNTTRCITCRTVEAEAK